MVRPLLILAAILSIVVFTYYKQPHAPTNPANFSEDKEDEQSMYTIPKDVLEAMSQSKATGNPVLGIRTDGPTYHIPILMYHYVEHVADANDKGRIALNTPPEVLDAEIKTLKDAGYDFINTSDLADILDGMKDPPKKPVILTFDDSYRDFYTDAFPILKKYNVKSVQYVITGSLNTSLHMDLSQLKEIAKSGLVEIGSHTVNHIALAGQGVGAKAEMADSKIFLEKELGIPVTAFAYPYGSFDIDAVQSAKQVGFRTAVSTVPGSTQANQSRLFAYRLRPGGRTGQALLNLLEQ